jgi:hypothetical protein
MLTAYQLSCGYVQQHERNGICVTLWREHTVYHVRVHDFNSHERIAWYSFRTITPARRAYRKAVLHLAS